MKVYLGLGANLGQPALTIREALRLLEARGLGRVLRVSSLYRTEPVGKKDQPWFINAAAEVETEMEVTSFFRELKKIEIDLGREPAPEKNGPRVLDVDLLFWGEEVISQPELEIPHPRLHQRNFVLAPLSEIAPQFRHPRQGRSVAELYKSSTDTALVEKISD